MKFELRPIRSEREYKRARRALDMLWDARAGTRDADVAEMLIMLIAAYEDEHEPAIEPPDPVDAIKFRLDQMGLDAKALEGVIGSRTRVWEVLTGRRELSLAMIRALHARFGISTDVLIKKSTRKVAN